MYVILSSSRCLNVALSYVVGILHKTWQSKQHNFFFVVDMGDVFKKLSVRISFGESLLQKSFIVAPAALCLHEGLSDSRQWSARVVFSISRQEWEFLRLNLVHRDETESSWHLLSDFETRPRKNFLQSRASRRDRDLLSSLSGIETRTRIPLIWSRFSRRDREFWNWISSTFLTGQDLIFHHFFVKIFAVS